MLKYLNLASFIASVKYKKRNIFSPHKFHSNILKILFEKFPSKTRKYDAFELWFILYPSDAEIDFWIILN